MKESFIRNHTLYLVCSLVVVVGSHLLTVVDTVTNWWHVLICMLLSLLPKARVVFPVHKPSSDYHPAILVTGTSSGIGHDTAIALASKGFTVFAGVRRWEDGARVENDFLDSIKPQTIYKNRWARPSWVERLLANIHRSLGATEEQPEPEASSDDEATIVPQTVTSRRLRRRKQRSQAVNGKTEHFDPNAVSARDQSAPEYEQLVRETGSIIPVILDVADKKSIDGAFDKVSEELEKRGIPLVGLVNNAGVTASGPMDIAATSFIDYCMAVNFAGPVGVAQKFMPLLRASSGRIVNVSSIMAWLIGPGFGVYCASKAALSAASRAWHFELANSGMSVSVVEPGLTRTALWKKLEAELQFHHSRLNGLPLRRRRSAEQIDDESGRESPVAMPGDEAVATPSSSPATPANEPERSENQTLYDPMIRRIQTSNELAPIFALPTHHAVGAILHSLTSSYPKSTYRVGWDARWMSLATWLASEEVVEWVCRVIGIVSDN
ncbi:NAD(P)-binding protein [Linderina pennispora]|uniref:NAD(P)-binding protein n=1 Tax=Linderina pennispora TaxID=61395 RepID=A0A1Y1WJS0_9FUNG|nr:NAD(P)-binding protein [Linderina pennispora]ORX73605.1 NAD(P)-binding protein [Linderina pennispora]